MSEVDTEVSLTVCPMCSTETPNLLRVDTGLRLGLVESGVSEIPDQICEKCMKEWRKKISQGVRLKGEKEAKSHLKQDLWQNRIKVVRQGRQLFAYRSYGEAAIAYEKYLKILELVYGVTRAELKPSLFQERPKEITVISSVLWDLMLIYDASPKYLEKQEEAATMLASFLKYSPLYANLVRKAELEFRRAKNPACFRNFLKACNANISRCFIASAAFASHGHPTVMTLCHFRDQVLKQHDWGRQFVLFYYKYSPYIASWLDRWSLAKAPLRILLRGVAILLKGIFRLP